MPKTSNTKYLEQIFLVISLEIISIHVFWKDFVAWEHIFKVRQTRFLFMEYSCIINF